MLDYDAFDRSPNFFTIFPHLQYLIRRENDDTAVADMLEEVGKVTAVDFASRALENDKTGARLVGRVGDIMLSRDDYNIFQRWIGRLGEIPSDIPEQVELALVEQAEGAPHYLDVELPEGTRQSLRQMREMGFYSATIPEEYDGLGLENIVGCGITLMTSAADASLFVLSGLTIGVAETLEEFAPEEIRKREIPKLCSYDPDACTSGAMHLTEREAGSDLNKIATIAKLEDGVYRLYGEKIFISNPEADKMCVLARTEGAAEGTKGLSFFLVDRFKQDGAPNNSKVESLEDKMGIKSSSTGTVLFEGAEGQLIGEEGEGFKEMLYLMNKARLAVGTQGLGIAFRAFHESVRYSRQREAFGTTLDRLPGKQETLVDMAINLEAATSLVFKTYSLLDEYLEEEDGAEKDRLGRLIRMLIPLSKYRGSELSVTMSNQAVDNLGGFGYIKEYEVERLARDAKITTIYEGTTDIQVMDVQRAIHSTKEKALNDLVAESKHLLRRVKDPALKPYVSRVKAFIRNVMADRLELGGSGNPFFLGMVRARRYADTIVNMVEASLMLDEAQERILVDGDYRKAAMAIKYIDDNMVAAGPNRRFVEEGIGFARKKIAKSSGHFAETHEGRLARGASGLQRLMEPDATNDGLMAVTYFDNIIYHQRLEQL